MKVVAITRIRNESGVIEHTLEHVSKFVDAIYVYDDCSIDNTIDICKSFSKVKGIFKSKKWSSDPIDRMRLEGTQRQFIYEKCLVEKPDWIYYFDADEFAFFEGVDLSDSSVGGYRMRLFDFYITEQDKQNHFLERKYMGPEFRDILTLFRPAPKIHFPTRLPGGISNKIKNAGFIKHYGKAISVENWENKCDYYINHLFENQPGNSTISEKWRKRKGKAIHVDMSDYNRKLITWSDRKNESTIINNSTGAAE